MALCSAPHRGALCAAALALLAGTSYAFWRPAVPAPGWIPRPAPLAAWVERAWLEQPQSEAATRAFVDRLVWHGVEFAFVHHTPMNAAGRNPAYDPEQCRRLSAAARERSRGAAAPLRVLAWVGGRSTVRLRSPEQRRSFAEDVGRLVRDCGLSGAHLNIEPLRRVDGALAAWLAELRAAMGPGRLLSVAATRPHLLGTVDLSPVPSWGPSDYAELSRHVDQIAVMSYDTWLVGAKLYTAYMRRSTRLVAQAVRRGPNPSCGLLMGVPTYSERRPYFHAGAENLRSGLAGILSGNLDLLGDGIAPPGLAVYASWTTDAGEWRELDDLSGD
ncbi:MAG: glycoside hydrolase family 18 protein [Elusimicrobia bacterium]|nr:glycoside hydrolase family 18 protein [Elusimicrobiota bacterium]